MNLSKVKEALLGMERLIFQLPDEEFVPDHFHVTEVGFTVKHFIDCGGVQRQSTVVNFQLWTADDFDHKLAPEKLKSIIRTFESNFGNFDDTEVEVEYQSDTIGKYGLEFNQDTFVLTNKNTDCLAKDKCGVECCGE